MATLSIQNFPDQLYEKLLARAEQERRSIAQEVIHLLEQATELREPLSILGLRGLGKEHWKGVDPVSHVEAERDSWD
jgi:hypothetical protein